MGPIFNEKIAEKSNLWVREQCMNSNHITPQRVKTKQKKKKKGTKRED